MAIQIAQFVWFIRIADPYVSKFFFYISLLFWRWKPTKIHRILLTKACTPLEIKYTSKSPLTKTTYTKWQKFCGKKRYCTNKKLNLLLKTVNTIRIFLLILKITGCPSKNAGCSKQFPGMGSHLFFCVLFRPV